MRSSAYRNFLVASARIFLTHHSPWWQPLLWPGSQKPLIWLATAAQKGNDPSESAIANRPKEERLALKLRQSSFQDLQQVIIIPARPPTLAGEAALKRLLLVESIEGEAA